MHIQLLYFEECPSHEQALERLQQALAEEQIEAEVDVVRVETEAQAQQVGFPGSPTFLVNGADCLPPAAGTPSRLTCRAYQLEDGRIGPLPSLAMLRAALRDTHEK
jgi:protein-disulfide isomerase